MVELRVMERKVFGRVVTKDNRNFKASNIEQQPNGHFLIAFKSIDTDRYIHFVEIENTNTPFRALKEQGFEPNYFIN